MAKYDETYERAVAKLLTDHVEQGIPADIDLWATVEQRLAQRNSPAPAVHTANKQSRWQDFTNRLLSPNTSTVTKKRPYFGFAMGTLGLALVALLTIISISRFAQIGNGIPTNRPTTLSDALFTIPVNEANIHWHTDNWVGTTGIAVAQDGTFYIADADGQRLHYSRTGSLINAGSYHIASSSKHNFSPLFFTVQGNDIWMYSPPVDLMTNVPRVVSGFSKFSPDGAYLGGYNWESTTTPEPPTVLSGTKAISIVAGIVSLQIGGDGQFLVETTPLNDQNVPDYTKSYLIQIIGSDGKPDLKLLPGYPAGGKYYTTEVTPGSRSGYVTNGDIRVEITSTLYIRRLDVDSVRPDGSFYVISEERVTPAPNSNGGDTVSTTFDANYIYHYSASGNLIERARIPGDFVPHIDAARRLTQDANGNFYWLQPVFPPQGGDPISVGIHRINFFPAGQPLPGTEPTATPTNIPTIAPRVPTIVPTPMTIAELPDYSVLFPLLIGNPPSGRVTFGGNYSMADDGTVWVDYDRTLQGERVLRQISTDGRLLTTINVPSEIKSAHDINVADGNIWVLDADVPAVYKMAMDGSIVDIYHPILPQDFPRHPPGLNQFHFRRAYDGQLLVEDVYSSTYTKADPTLDSNGNPNNITYPGYPGNGKYYVKGAQPNQIAVSSKTVTIQVEGNVYNWQIARELPDGSFYAIVNATGTAGMAQGQYIYVLHYSVDGKLIERARAASPGEASGTFATRSQDIQIAPDNTFYAVGSPGVDMQHHIDPGWLALVRLKFHPANEPLPPVPTQLPSELFTPLPAGMQEIPTPVPSSTK